VDGLLVERANGVVTLTINRPERKNAITGEMWRGLAEIFDDLATGRDDRVLVITGAGDAFCSGADLTAAADGEAASGTGAAVASMRMVGRAALRLHELPLPTVAAVNGVAAGAGCNLALGCDLIVASDRARFTEIFARRGLALDFGDFPVYLYGGFSGDRYTTKQNAPIDQTHSGPYIGLGVRF